MLEYWPKVTKKKEHSIRCVNCDAQSKETELKKGKFHTLLTYRSVCMCVSAGEGKGTCIFFTNLQKAKENHYHTIKKVKQTLLPPSIKGTVRAHR